MMTVSKKLMTTLNRLVWNKVRTVNTITFEKRENKMSFRVSFTLSHPYSSNSSILVVVRNSGVINRWVSLKDYAAPEKETMDLFEGKTSIEFEESDANAVVKQLLKEIMS